MSLRSFRHPGESVVSREVSKDFERGLIAKASEPGAIVVGDEVVDIDITFLGGFEPAMMAGGIIADPVEMFAEPTIEALNHAVCLRPEGPDEPMGNTTYGTQAVERVLTRRLARWFGLFVDGEAIRPFPAIVSEHGMNRMRKVRQKALKKGTGGSARALIEDLDIDVSGCPVDRHEGIGTLATQSGQVLDIEMDEAASRALKSLRLLAWHRLARGDAMALKATMNGAARELRIYAALHDLHDIVQRQIKRATQLNDQRLLTGRQAGVQLVRLRRAIGGIGASAPASDGGFMNPKLVREFGNRSRTRLDIGPCFRGRRGIGMQLQVHGPSLLRTRAMPNSTPIRSIQCPGTKHESRDDE
jgi:hypothetical protein